MSEFGQALTSVLYDRMEHGTFMKGLEGAPEYRSAKRDYDEAYTEVAGAAGLSSGSREQQLISTIRRLHDIEMQYVYRVGIQDGARLTHPDFLLEGIA